MTQNETLLIRNLLNGVEPAAAARAAGLTEEEGMSAFAEAMKRVAEYRLVHCMPFFECGTLAAARASRFYVLDALERIGRWDEKGRDLMIAYFSGQRPDAAEQEIKNQIAGVLLALPHYLECPRNGDGSLSESSELRRYMKDKREFVKSNRKRVIALLERFVSFRAPLLFKNIDHETIAQVG